MRTTGERLARNAIEEREQVAVDDTDVVEPTVFDRVEHRDHARRVHLDADHIEFGLGCGHLDRRLAVTETDVEHDVAIAAEHLGPVEHGSVQVETPPEDPLVELGLALR